VNRFDYHAGTHSNYRSACRVQVTVYLTGYCNFAYSALASFRMGMSGSASFQTVRTFDRVLRFRLLQEYNIGIGVAADHPQLAAIERPMKV
jgi:hypothetical protein